MKDEENKTMFPSTDAGNRHHGLFLLLLIVFLGMACTALAEKREHLADPTLTTGMALLAPEAVNGAGVKIDTLRFVDNDAAPLWRLCSWTFATNLHGTDRQRTRYGKGFADDAFLIVRSNKGVITMKVAASKVYDSPRADSSQPWINFLLEREFDTLKLADASTAMLSYDMRILACHNCTGEAYDTNIHAAQFLAYLYVRNTNKASADYMKGLWLGVGMYDNRCPQGMLQAPVTSWDIGTSTYIHNPAGTTLFTGSPDLNDSQWHTVKVDIRKAVEEAIQALSSNGYLSDSKPDDFTVNYMNIGWELPGTFDVTGQFRNLRITSEPLSETARND